VASKRSASCVFFKAKTGVFVPFSAVYARRLMPVNRALKEARVPCALFAALEAKHHHPQLAQRCISAACAACRACHQLRLLLVLRFYCRLHELSNTQQEVDTAAAEN
jgi:hypothetical protein